MKSIGIIAGSGQFPFLVAEHAKKSGYTVIACGFTNNTDPNFKKSCDTFIMLELGQLETLIKFFKSHNVSQLCMAGAISKPRALDFKPDLRAAKLLFKLMGSRGDNAILIALADELKNEGINVVKPDELIPGLANTPSGLLAGSSPSFDVWQDIAFGWATANGLGSFDIGQCIAVRDRVIVAVEGIEGTDAMLKRAGKLTLGCTAIKRIKPGQDERLDKPSIGLTTVELLKQYQYNALAFEAGKTLFFDQDAALAMANKAGIAIIAIPTDADTFFKKNMQ